VSPDPPGAGAAHGSAHPDNFIPTAPAVRRLVGSLPREGVAVSILTAAVLGFGYLLLQPRAPDLLGQLARASAVSRGAGLWWAGWYGGINTATYSLLSADLMSALGVGTIGLLATAVICVCGADLVRSAERPRAGALAISVAACANLYSGRITFAAGMATALMSFCLLRRDRRLLAAASALVTGFISPLAALCLLLGLAALLVSGDRRVASVVGLMAASMLPVAIVSIIFGQPSYMPFSADYCAFALLTCGTVALAPVPRVVRAMALLSALVAVGAGVIHSPIGSNAARMPMLAAAPVVIATARRGQTYVKALAASLVIWPLMNFSSEMAIAAQPSAQPTYYGALLAHLPAAGRAVQRLEVLDPASHGATFYLSTQVPLARGWERQVDAATNPIFYSGELTAHTYRGWLVAHAVGWVAVPSASLDYSAVAEEQLIASGLPYLRLTWTNRDWQLYRVTSAATVASGVLRATSLRDTEVDLVSSAAGQGTIQVPYSRLLTIRSTVDPTVVGCVSRGPDGDVLAAVPEAGPYVLHAEAASLTKSCHGPGQVPP
jgi:hypothetical protein